MVYLRKLIDALKRIKVETGSLVCLGCGYENSCGVRGCSILRNAAMQLELLAECFSDKTVLDFASHILGPSPERLQELSKADEEGRLFISPVKVGDMLWAICWDRVAKEWVVDEGPTRVNEVGTMGFFISESCDDADSIDEFHPYEEIGDEYFRTREEALEAAAVKERTEGDSQTNTTP